MRHLDGLLAEGVDAVLDVVVNEYGYLSPSFLIGAEGQPLEQRSLRLSQRATMFGPKPVLPPKGHRLATLDFTGDPAAVAAGVDAVLATMARSIVADLR